MDLNAMIDNMLGVSSERSTWRISDPEQLERELERRFGRVTRSNGHNGLELICDCPVCGKHKLSVNAVSGVYKCWHGCMSGTARKLLNKHLPMTKAPAKKVTRSYGYIDPGTLIPLHTVAADNPAAVYLASRGFDYRELGSTYGFSYCSSGRSFARGIFSTTGTVVASVVMNGKTVGWQSRLLYDPDKVDGDRCRMLGFKWDAEEGKYKKPPKYMTMPGMDKRDILWNFDNARKSDVVVVTEGVFDAVKVGRCGVATLGKAVSNQQINLLQQYWKHIILLLDPDAKEDEELLSRKFGHTVDVVSVVLRGYKDAGEAPRVDIWGQIIDACIADGVDPGTFNVEI